MKPDAYTKFILTVIALCLVVLAWDALEQAAVPTAHAQLRTVVPDAASGDTVSCNVPGKGYKRCLPVIIGQ